MAVDAEIDADGAAPFAAVAADGVVGMDLLFALHLLLHLEHIAHAAGRGALDDADAVGIDMRDVELCVAHGGGGGGEAVLHGKLEPVQLHGFQMILDFEALNLRRDFHRQLAHVVARGRLHAADAAAQGVPEFLDGQPVRGDHPDAGDDHAPFLRLGA